MKNTNYQWLTTTYIAHRGLFDNIEIPENSIPAFEKASRHGFSIETDVQATKDGVLVVFHDDNMERMTGAEGRLCDHTFRELRELNLGNTGCKIPTFEEFLQAAGGASIVVEIKTHDDIGETEQKVCSALKDYKGHYCVESFNPRIVRWFKVNAPHIVRGQLSCSFKGMPLPKYQIWLLKNLKLCKWNGSQFVAYDATTIADCKAVARWRKKVPIICWTVTSQQQYIALSKHFDNMIFDSFLPERWDLEGNSNN